MTNAYSKNEKARFDVLSDTLSAHPSNAQILVEVDDSSNTLKRALSVLADVNMTPVRQQVIKTDGAECILMFLPTEDMKEAVLTLTEAGFTRVKGINAESHYPGKEAVFRTPLSDQETDWTDNG